MAFEPVAAVCDACVLYPFHLRNVLVQVSVDGLYDARWTDRIHDEWTRNLLTTFPDIAPERFDATRRLMEAALPSARVLGFEHHEDRIRLPDPDDHHVVAAAIEAKATHILTWNLRDFPAAELNRHGLVSVTPDAFLCDLHDRAPDMLVASLANARRNLTRSSSSAKDFVDMLRDQKLARLSDRLSPHLRRL